ncbi:methyltransferase domain-containing protein [Plantactinospora sp. B6F1]|uniref:methyltransferase domain-containing protein n=1 Tax=Plantactinospora sp. B6F1 TaxID=3158971 RepID=UPI00102BDA38
MMGHSHTDHERSYLPAMGKDWLLPLYDPFIRLAGVGRVHGQLLDRADLRPGQRILEIGCGTGNLLRALGRRVPDVEAVGIDPDPAALRRARRKATRSRLPIRYERAFADELPLPDGGFDRVLSAFMLHHLAEEDRIPALREVGRVLRPGGELHVVDIDGTPSGHGPGRLHRNPRVMGSLPERVLAALADAGLTGVAENGRGRAWFGRYVFYRAEARQRG